MAETTTAATVTAAKVTSIRADEETMDKFRDLAAKYGNQGQALAALVAMHESQQLRSTMPDRQAEFDTIETHLSAIREMFAGSMQLAASTAERVKTEMRAEFTAQAVVITSLREQLVAEQQKNKSLSTRVDIAESRAAVADAREETIKALRDQLEATRQMMAIPKNKSKAEQKGADGKEPKTAGEK